MIDRDIAATMLSADPAGLANAYDAYAGKLHAYCWTMLRDHDAAADAVQDTFIVADKCIGQLRDPDRLRPWLYAIARNECLRQLRASARSAPFEEAGDVIDESAGDVGRGLDQEETRRLVWDAAAGLNTGEYEVLELNLRHELEGADLAAALGVSRNHAHALLSRARAQFEISLAALLVARTGRGTCETLDALLTDWDGGITALLRKRINRHIEQCEVCGERKRRELRPAMLMSSLPFMVAPPLLRDKVLKLVADPTASAYHRMVVDRAGPFGPDGFVKPLEHPGSGANSNTSQGNDQGGNQGGQGGDGGAPGSGAAPAPESVPAPGPGPGPGPAVAAVAAAEWLPPWSPPEAPPEMLPQDDDVVPRDRHTRRKGPLVGLVLLFLLVIVAGTLLYLDGTSAPAAGGAATAPPITALTTFSATAAPSAAASDATTVTVAPTVTITVTASPSPAAARTAPQAPPQTSRAAGPTPTRGTPSPPPTQTTAPTGTVTGPATFQFEPSANGGPPTGSFRVSETGGVLSGVRVSVSDPKVLQAASGDAVRNTDTIGLTAETIYSNPVTVTISAADATPLTVTVSWPTQVQ